MDTSKTLNEYKQEVLKSLTYKKVSAFYLTGHALSWALAKAQNLVSTYLIDLDFSKDEDNPTPYYVGPDYYYEDSREVIELIEDFRISCIRLGNSFTDNWVALPYADEDYLQIKVGMAMITGSSMIEAAIRACICQAQKGDEICLIPTFILEESENGKSIAS
jgi:hypothetical protein